MGLAVLTWRDGPQADNAIYMGLFLALSNADNGQFLPGHEHAPFTFLYGKFTHKKVQDIFDSGLRSPPLFLNFQVGIILLIYIHSCI